MPKKFQGENSKASVAKARKAEAAAQEKQKRDQALEDAYWQDDDKSVKKKQARKEEREKKRLAEVDKKAQLRALAAEEESSTVIATPKAAPHVTLYQLEKNKEEQAAKEKAALKKETQSHLEMPLMENLNRTTEDVVSASGVDAALSALSVQENSGDLHPERRMAAAFKTFEAKRLPQIKKENPTLRLTQQKQMLRKEWQKSPENPLNLNKK